MPEGMSHPWGRPGDLLRHPVALIALAAWLLNDHVLKSAFGNEWTGKLSDGAGLIVFPLLLLSVCTWLIPSRLEERGVRTCLLGFAMLIAGGILVLLNVSEWTAAWCAVTLAHGLWWRRWPDSGEGLEWIPCERNRGRRTLDSPLSRSDGSGLEAEQWGPPGEETE